MNLLKGTSARRLFQRFPELKLDAHTLSFWQRGYGSKSVPLTAAVVTATYIRTQWERLEGYERPSHGDRLAR
jgi:REP element-mobilizing transposase RayT